MLRHDRPDRFRTTEQPVGWRSRFCPTLVSGSKRSGEIRIGGDEISGRARRSLSGRASSRSRIARSCSASSMASAGSVGAGQPSRACGRCLGSSRELGEVGQADPRRPERLQAHRKTERVAGLGRDRGGDRRNKSAAQLRRPQAPAQDAPLRAGSGSSRDRRRSARARQSSKIGSSTILRGNIFSARPARIPRRSSCPARPRLARRRLSRSVAEGGGTATSRSKGFEHDQDFVQRHWPHGSHRRQLRQHRQHPVGLLERSSRERAQLVEPLAPVRRLGQSCRAHR